jgi:hypothetical protein
MDKLDAKLLQEIERALNFKFYDWQVNYILDIPMVLDMKNTGRGTGKTLAYVIKLLFLHDRPIKAYDDEDLWRHSDWWCVTSKPDRKEPHYTQWFRKYLIEIYYILKSAGITSREVIIDKYKVGDVEKQPWSIPPNIRFKKR